MAGERKLNRVAEGVVTSLPDTSQPFLCGDATANDEALTLGQYISGAASEQTFTIANNQVAAADVTGLVFVKTSYSYVVINYSIVRSVVGSRKFTGGTITLYHDGTNWSYELGPEVGNGSGVVLSATTAGQVQYTSTNLAGASYAGQMKYKISSYSD